MKENIVTLNIPEGKYKYLKSTLEAHKNLLHLLSLVKPVKQTLIEDVQIIRTIINTGEKGEI